MAEETTYLYTMLSLYCVFLSVVACTYQCKVIFTWRAHTQRDINVLNPVVSPKQRVARFTSYQCKVIFAC